MVRFYHYGKNEKCRGHLWLLASSHTSQATHQNTPFFLLSEWNLDMMMSPPPAELVVPREPMPSLLLMTATASSCSPCFFHPCPSTLYFRPVRALLLKYKLNHFPFLHKSHPRLLLLTYRVIEFLKQLYWAYMISSPAPSPTILLSASRKPCSSNIWNIPLLLYSLDAITASAPNGLSPKNPLSLPLLS